MNWVQHAGCKPSDTGALELEFTHSFLYFEGVEYIQIPVVLPEGFKSLTDLIGNVLNKAYFYTPHNIVSSGSLYAAKHTWEDITKQ